MRTNHYARTHYYVGMISMLLLVTSCEQRKKSITVFNDYKGYLTPSVVTSHPTDAEMTFWNDRLIKNEKDETSLVKLAGLYAERFRTTGVVEDIFLSDSLYKKVLKNMPEGNTDMYHCLAANAITQHKFRLANDYAEKALALKDKKAASLLILTDVSLELGDFAKATQKLKQFKNKNSFAYLIRRVKLKDHEGNLDTAILLMEKAYERIKGNKSLSQWTLTNLADMYGHAGRIEDAYQMYLKVLKNNPQDDYALKGIAWIALANDHNTTDSKRIIETLASRKRMPEAYLMLAEIAEANNEVAEKKNYLMKFKSMVDQPAYKTMYHKYLATLEAEEFQNPEACITIAKEEITNRPTPQSFDLLAWGYYYKKNYREALKIIRQKVEHQTFEPDAYYHMGMIYAATGDQENARKYLKNALESDFELGPSISKRIKETLNTLL
jgi:tetratricopeptide (TPR) repeat protein